MNEHGYKAYVMLVRIYGTDEFHLVNPLPNTQEYWEDLITTNFKNFDDVFQFIIVFVG